MNLRDKSFLPLPANFNKLFDLLHLLHDFTGFVWRKSLRFMHRLQVNGVAPEFPGHAFLQLYLQNWTICSISCTYRINPRDVFEESPWDLSWAYSWTIPRMNLRSSSSDFPLQKIDKLFNPLQVSHKCRGFFEKAVPEFHAERTDERCGAWISGRQLFYL